MAELGHLSSEINDGVASITFSTSKGNSLPGSLLTRLAQEFDKYSIDSRATVIILRSSGEGPFCAGASFQELQEIRDQKSGAEFFLGFAKVILAMKNCPKFIIARVQGKAVGGGVGLVAAADYALAVNSASIKLSELALGIGPFVVGPAVERKIGHSAFASMSIDTDWYDAAWAKQKGLYASVYDNTVELDKAILTLASRLSKSSPEAMSRLKEVLWSGTESWEKLLPERAAISGKLVLSDFTRNAIRQFAQFK